MNINNAVDKKYEELSLSEILDVPVDAIQGVSENDSKLLKCTKRPGCVEDLLRKIETNLRLFYTDKSVFQEDFKFL